MRKLLIGIGLWSALGSVGQLSAQTPNGKLYEKDHVISSAPGAPGALDRIHERAALEARERLARIESRHWNGISLQRPTIYVGPNYIVTNPAPLRSAWQYPIVHSTACY